MVKQHIYRLCFGVITLKNLKDTKLSISEYEGNREVVEVYEEVVEGEV